MVVTYINEPFPNAHNQPHRHLTREELEQFFAACDIVVKFNNPDRVIKHVDGDYDPTSTDMPDNHCYPMWYNAHGIDIGKLNKGYWIPVKPGWYHGCGEYGAEGLDFAEVMKSDYPKEWLEEPFNPKNIVNAQTGNFHYFFYDTPDSLDEWVEESQRHQAYATTIMTEAFRRESRMVSQAIHLFIDAWPSGWMKTIMDCKRTPKPAYFAYRNALEPMHISLRTDRYTYCEVTDREKFTLKAILSDACGKVIDYNSVTLEVFADCEVVPNEDVVLIEKLQPGEYEIAGEQVKVKKCSMLPLHFVSRKTGHAAVQEFEAEDFKNWYDAKEDMITPIIENTFLAEGFTPILLSGNLDEEEEWNPALAATEKWHQGKRYVICQVDLRQENPVAKRFLGKLFKTNEKKLAEKEAMN